MSLLMVANYEPDVGYAWSFIQKFWLTLAAYPGQCHLAYPRRGPVPDEILKSGITVHWQSMRGLDSAAFLRRHGIRHVYLTDWPALSPLYGLWRLSGVKDIIVHDHAPGDSRPSTGVRGMLKSAAHSVGLFSGTQYVSVAEHVRRRHIQTWRVSPDQCVVVQNGIRPFQPDHSQRAVVRAELGIPMDAPVFLLVGRANRYKGIDFAIRCLAMLPATVHFIHIGDGPHLEEFRLLALGFGVENRMHFLGKRDDVQRIASACDAAFHPSRGEAMSLAILEHMCARLPVVVPSLPSVSLAIDHMLTGLIYEDQNLDAAVTALNALADDEKLRSNLGAAAHAKVLRSYTSDRTMREFIELVVAPMIARSSVGRPQAQTAGYSTIQSDREYWGG